MLKLNCKCAQYDLSCRRAIKLHPFHSIQGGKCYVHTQLFLACTCVYLFLVCPVAIFRTGFSFVEYCSGSLRSFLQSDY